MLAPTGKELMARLLVMGLLSLVSCQDLVMKYVDEDGVDGALLCSHPDDCSFTGSNKLAKRAASSQEAWMLRSLPSETAPMMLRLEAPSWTEMHKKASSWSRLKRGSSWARLRRGTSWTRL